MEIYLYGRLRSLSFELQLGIIFMRISKTAGEVRSGGIRYLSESTQNKGQGRRDKRGGGGLGLGGLGVRSKEELKGGQGLTIKVKFEV